MPDSFTPNMNLCKPEANSTGWDTKINNNLDLIDPLETRVAALEALHGAEIPGYWVLPPGSTWDDLISTYDGASAGDTIVLPNETINATSIHWIKKSITILGHPSGASKFLVDTIFTENTDPNYSGAALAIFAIGKGEAQTLNGVRLSNFTIEHDRVAQPSMRQSGIAIPYQVSDVEIDHITFTNITSDCLIIWPWDGTIDNLSMHDCTADEWYEGFFNWHWGYGTNITVYNNTGTVTTQKGGFQGPMGLELNVEQSSGGIVGCSMSNNSFTVSGSALRGAGTIGAVLNFNTIYTTYWKKISFNNNTLDGFLLGFYVANIHQIDTGEENIVFQDNIVDNCGTGIYVWPEVSSASETDWLLLFGNHLTGNGTAINVDLSRQSAPHVLNVWGTTGYGTETNTITP